MVEFARCFLERPPWAVAQAGSVRPAGRAQRAMLIFVDDFWQFAA